MVTAVCSGRGAGRSTASLGGGGRGRGGALRPALASSGLRLTAGTQPSSPLAGPGQSWPAVRDPAGLPALRARFLGAFSSALQELFSRGGLPLGFGLPLDVVGARALRLLLDLVDVPKDGNCFFSALSHQLTRGVEAAAELRQRFVAHLANLPNVAELVRLDSMDAQVAPPAGLEAYLDWLCTPGTWAGQLAQAVIPSVLMVTLHVLYVESTDAGLSLGHREYAPSGQGVTEHVWLWYQNHHFHSFCLEPPPATYRADVPTSAMRAHAGASALADVITGIQRLRRPGGRLPAGARTRARRPSAGPARRLSLLL